jgi:arylsulfatase A-like enzyme
VPRGRSSDALVYLHDLHATVLDLAGLPVDPPATDTHSRTLVPLWLPDRAPASTPPPAPRQRLLLAFTDTMRAVRTDRWKLIRYPQVDVTQVFDLLADPHERTDLAGLDAARTAEMRRVLEEAQAAAGDKLPWSAATIRPARVDLRDHPRDPYASRPWDAPAR